MGPHMHTSSLLLSYLVDVVDRKTGQETSIVVEALSREEAESYANKTFGYLVSSSRVIDHQQVALFRQLSAKSKPLPSTKNNKRRRLPWHVLRGWVGILLAIMVLIKIHLNEADDLALNNFFVVCAFVSFLLILEALLRIVASIANIPGKIARRRNHPAADAINVCAWFGLFLGILFWIVAYIWAHTVPELVHTSSQPNHDT